MKYAKTFRVSGLKEGPNSFRFDCTAQELDLPRDPSFEVRLTRPARVELDLLRKHDRVYVSGEVNFQLQLPCADCAQAFVQDFKESVYIEFQKGRPPSGHRVHELGEDEMVRTFYTTDEVDLLPMIRDTILLAVPIAPRCRADCRGICPECGTNLNQGPCTCAEQVDRMQ